MNTLDKWHYFLKELIEQANTNNSLIEDLSKLTKNLQLGTIESNQAIFEKYQQNLINQNQLITYLKKCFQNQDSKRHLIKSDVVIYLKIRQYQLLKDLIEKNFIMLENKKWHYLSFSFKQSQIIAYFQINNDAYFAIGDQDIGIGSIILKRFHFLDHPEWQWTRSVLNDHFRMVENTIYEQWFKELRKEYQPEAIASLDWKMIVHSPIRIQYQKIKTTYKSN